MDEAFADGVRGSAIPAAPFGSLTRTVPLGVLRASRNRPTTSSAMIRTGVCSAFSSRWPTSLTCLHV